MDKNLIINQIYENLFRQQELIHKLHYKHNYILRYYNKLNIVKISRILRESTYILHDLYINLNNTKIILKFCLHNKIIRYREIKYIYLSLKRNIINLNTFLFEFHKEYLYIYDDVNDLNLVKKISFYPDSFLTKLINNIEFTILFDFNLLNQSLDYLEQNIKNMDLNTTKFLKQVINITNYDFKKIDYKSYFRRLIPDFKYLYMSDLKNNRIINLYSKTQYQ